MFSIKMTSSPKTVDAVVGFLQKSIADLEAVAEHHDLQSEKHMNDIDDLTFKLGQSVDEAKRAKAVAGKLRGLLEA